MLKGKTKDFFVSYTGTDTQYATWIAELLESEGFKVEIQAWDFRPGDNFVKKIDDALQKCDKLIVVLSRNYLRSEWCRTEWTSKLAEKSNPNDGSIIPIRVEPVEVEGLLSPIVYIDIVDKDESNAKQCILEGIRDVRVRKSFGFPSYYNLRHQEIDIDYYVSEQEITYIKTCRSVILTGGKNTIHNRITWFADEDVKLSSLTKSVYIELIDLRDTNLDYNIVFDHILEVGEEIEFSVKAQLTNRNRHFDNFFSTEVIVPIELLSVHLNLDGGNVSKIYTQKLCSSPMNARTEQPKPHTFRSPFHWHIRNPELNFEYKIFW